MNNDNKIDSRKSSYAPIQYLEQIIHLYGDYISWSLMSAFIVYSSFVYPEYYTKSFYKRLIYVTASKERLGHDADKIFRQLSVVIKRPNLQAKIPPGTKTIDFFRALKKQSIDNNVWLDVLMGVSDRWGDLCHGRLVCAIQHPEQSSCAKGSLMLSIAIFRKMLGNYFIINIVNIYNVGHNKSSFHF